MKAMISQPMANMAEWEIAEVREKVADELHAMGYRVVDTFFKDEWYSNQAMHDRGVTNIPLCFLAKSLEKMSECDAVCFCKGWESSRGCRIEHDAAKAYGLTVLYV